jgi:asparagine synthetase B (glutamine-hydrolysing)
MKTVLIYSGGLDSTVLLYELRAAGDEVLALSIDYGQRHRRELAHAERIARASNGGWRTWRRSPRCWPVRARPRPRSPCRMGTTPRSR